MNHKLWSSSLPGFVVGASNPRTGFDGVRATVIAGGLKSSLLLEA